MKLTRKDAQDILSTAIESGIAYWMNEDSTDVEINDTSDSAGVDGEWLYTGVEFMSDVKTALPAKYKVTPEIMVEKFPAFMSFLADTMRFRFKNWAIAFSDNDLAGMDAEDADVFFQWLCFGEVVYG